MVEAAVVVTVESLVVAKAAAKIVEGTGSITMVIVEGTGSNTMVILTGAQMAGRVAVRKL